MRVIKTHLSPNECYARVKYYSIKDYILSQDSFDRRYSVQLNRLKNTFKVRTDYVLHTELQLYGVRDNNIKTAVCRVVDNIEETDIWISFHYKLYSKLCCFIMPIFFGLVGLSFGRFSFLNAIAFGIFSLFMVYVVLDQPPDFKANDEIIFNALKSMLDGEDVTDYFVGRRIF